MTGEIPEQLWVVTWREFRGGPLHSLDFDAEAGATSAAAWLMEHGRYDGFVSTRDYPVDLEREAEVSRRVRATFEGRARLKALKEAL